MKRAVTVLMLCAVCAASANPVNAAVSGAINYQAVLMQNGTPVTTPTTVTFTVYDAASGGAPVWTESKSVTPDNLGRVSIQLGDLTPFPDAAFSSGERWLGITVQGDSEMLPRMKLASAASALRVASIDGAQAGSLTGDLRVVASASAKDASASEARLILVGLAGDSIILGPADQVILRAVDNLGAEAVSMEIDPLAGPVLSIRDPGGMLSEHSGSSSSYFDNAANKDSQALAKKLQVSADGVVLYGATESDTVASVDNAGVVTSKGLNVESDIPVNSAKEAMACGNNGGCGFNGNSCIGYGHNLSSAGYSMTIGSCNQLSASSYAFAVGQNHTMTGASGSATIGFQNSVNAPNSTALGRLNSVYSSDVFVSGMANVVGNAGLASGSAALGSSNEIQAINAFAVGENNYIGSPESIAMGRDNTLLGGGQNLIFGDSGYTSNAGDVVVGGGFRNAIVNGSDAVIDGGVDNSITGVAGVGNLYCTIGGGHNNEINTTTDPFPGDKGSSTILGGNTNTVTSSMAVICGGLGNTVSGTYAALVGGNFNTVTGDAAVIVGGDQHTASGVASVIVGGGLPGTFAERNVAEGDASFIGAGRRNRTQGDLATVPGGLSNEATGLYSFAAGRRAKAAHDGTFVWADQTDADFSSERADQFRVRADGGARFDDGTQYVDIRDDGTNLITTSAGACLSLGGVWGSCSDIKRKENINRVDYDVILAKIADLDVTEWNYKAEGNSIRHIGPMAQDFYAAFGLGNQDTHIGQIDADGIALAAIKALYNKTQELESQKTEIDALRDQIAELKQLVESMSHQR